MYIFLACILLHVKQNVFQRPKEVARFILPQNGGTFSVWYKFLAEKAALSATIFLLGKRSKHDF